MPGTTNLDAEVTHESKLGFRLLLADKELLVPFDQFPWFRKGTIEQISDLQWLSPRIIFIGRYWMLTCRFSPYGFRQHSRWSRPQVANKLLGMDIQPPATASRRMLRAGQRQR